MVAGFPPGRNGSTFDDMLVGRPLEPDPTVGARVAPGERLGVPTPATVRACKAVRPFASGKG